MRSRLLILRLLPARRFVPDRAPRCHAHVQPATLYCDVLFPLKEPDLQQNVLTTLSELSTSIPPASCDPLIREKAFQQNVMGADAATIGSSLANGAFLNNSASFMSGSLSGACAASVCMACYCRERMVSDAGAGYGTGVADTTGVCGPYTTAFHQQDEHRYVIIGISTGAMFILLMVRPASPLRPVCLCHD